MLTKLLHPSNAPCEIAVMLSGIVISARRLQPLNAYDPIKVTLSGIVM